MVENLRIIQTLERTGSRLDTLLAQHKYPETIKLLLGKVFELELFFFINP
jgi:hypothetical protein